MEEIRPSVYREERSRDEFLDVHRWARTHRGTPSEIPARVLLTPALAALFRPRHIGREQVPARGPAILASNHASHLDHFFIEIWLRRHPHFMAKSQLYANRLLRAFLKYGATFPVRRGREDEDAFESARIILERGGLVITYPEGGRTRTGKLGEPRRGVGRIALESGAPVVPVAIHGSVHARDWRRNWPRLRFPPVTVWFGEPLRFRREERPARERQQEVAERIFAPIRHMHGLLDEALASTRRGRVLRAARRGELDAARPEAYS